MYEGNRHFVLTLFAWGLLTLVSSTYFLRDLFSIYSWGEFQSVCWIAVLVGLFLCVALARWFNIFRWGVLAGASLICFVVGFRLADACANVLANTQNDFSGAGSAFALIVLVGSVTLVRRATQNIREFTVAMVVLGVAIFASVIHVQRYVDLVVRH
jgi:hypothetical protein